MIEPQTIRKRFEIAMQLVLSKDSRDLLENFRDSLIEHALYLNEPADAFKIKSIIESEMKLSCFTEHEIEQRLSRLNQESKIQLTNGKFTLRRQRRDGRDGRIRKCEQSLQDVCNLLITLIQSRKVSLSSNDRKLITDFLETFIAMYFAFQSLSALRSIVSTDKINNFVELPDPVRHPSLFRAAIDSYQLSDNLKTPLEDAMIELSKTETFANFVYELFQRYICYCVSRIDPGNTALNGQFFKDSTLLLDTNFVMDILLPIRDRHKIANSACSLSNLLGCQLLVTSLTEQEFQARLSDANYVYKNSSEERMNRIRRLDRGFIRDYVEKNKTAGNLTWDEYHMHWRTKFRQELTKLSIGIFPDCPKQIYDTPLFKHFCKVLSELSKELQHYDKPMERIEHDAYHLVLVDHLRSNSDAKPPRYWFVTEDTLLYPACRTVEGRKGIPLSVKGEAWFHVVSLFAPLFSKALGKNTAEVFRVFCSLPFVRAAPEVELDKFDRALMPLIQYDAYDDEQKWDFFSEKLITESISAPEEKVLQTSDVTLHIVSRHSASRAAELEERINQYRKELDQHKTWLEAERKEAERIKTKIRRLHLYVSILVGLVVILVDLFLYPTFQKLISPLDQTFWVLVSAEIAFLAWFSDSWRTLKYWLTKR